MKALDNVIQPQFSEVFKKDHQPKGKWSERFFENDHPLILELGCGKGEYTLGLAARNPNTNFIGIDIKGARIWKGAKRAQQANLINVAFLRTRVDFIESFFAKDEVSEIWITFPDPQPQESRVKKRLTSPRFLERYQTLLRANGTVNLKTDSDSLYDYTRNLIDEHGFKLLEHTDDLYGKKLDGLSPEWRDVLSIRTFYEDMWIEEGSNINYLRFSFAN